MTLRSTRVIEVIETVMVGDEGNHTVEYWSLDGGLLAESKRVEVELRVQKEQYEDDED